jgi:hypothetical protein
MRLEEINIGKTEESKRKAILANLGMQAILYDKHEDFAHVLLLKEDCGEVTYNVQIGDYRGKRRLEYSDLQKLIILYPLENHPLPQIDIDRIHESLIVYNDSKRTKKWCDLFNKLISTGKAKEVKPKDLKSLLAKS